MAVEEITKIFEIPSLKNLESEILKEFGKEGLEKFNKSDLKLDTAVNPFPEFHYNIFPLYGEDSIDQNFEEVGTIIDLNNVGDISGYFVKNAEVYVGKRENKYKVLIDFNLLKEKTLRIAFNLQL